MKYFILLVSTLFYQLSKSQTCIIIIVSSDTIFVGADSKTRQINSRIINNEIVRDTIYDVKCKISKCGEAYYSFAGWVSNKIDSTIRKQCEDDSTFYGNVYPFTVFTTRIFETELEQLRRTDSTRYIDVVKDTVIMSICYYGFISNIPTTYCWRVCVFKPFEKNIHIDYLSTKRQVTNRDSIEYFVLGESTFFGKRSINEKYKLMNGTNKAILIKNLITQQIHDTPKKVGKPINVVKITRNKELWVSPKNNSGCNRKKPSR